MSNVNLNETAPTRRRHAGIFARGDANRQSSEQQRAGMYWTCSFRRVSTSYAAGEVWLKRIAARKLDREPEAKP
jgi:hypothetical protein